MKKNGGFSEWLLEELIVSYYEARKNGKRKTKNEHELEINEIDNIVALRNAILARKYKPSKGIAFIIHDPVIREIFAAPFVDRIVHHFLFRHAISWWRPRLWRGTYACLKGRGTLAGVVDLQKNLRRVSQDGRFSTIVVKCDIQGYFMSLERRKLFDRVCWGLQRQYADGGELYRTLKFLWRQVIFDEPTKGVKRRGRYREWRELPVSKSLFYQIEGRGIVIGNLTSQLLSNIFLDLLDRYIVFELGYKNYGRYVDDFYIVVRRNDLEKLMKKDIPRISDFLADLGLVLHPKKQKVIWMRDGVDFLGAKIYYDHIVPGERIIKNLADRVYEFATTGKGEVKGFGSYDGLMAHYNSERIVRKIYSGVGWDYRNEPNRGGDNRRAGKSEGRNWEILTEYTTH